VQISRALYAMKSSKSCRQSGEDQGAKRLGRTPWIQVYLASTIDTRSRQVHSIYALTAGDLEQALVGRQQAAAARKATALQTPVMDAGQQVASTTSAPPAPKQQLCTWSQAQFGALAAEMLSAVGQLHAVNMRHADIKPSNFLVTKDNHLQLCDLGCAGNMHAKTMSQGTDLFMAPEQVAANYTAQ